MQKGKVEIQETREGMIVKIFIPNSELKDFIYIISTGTDHSSGLVREEALKITEDIYEKIIKLET